MGRIGNGVRTSCVFELSEENKGGAWQAQGLGDIRRAIFRNSLFLVWARRLESPAGGEHLQATERCLILEGQI